MIALPLGSMTGDIVASFLKRRLNIERGSSLPMIDQIDFLIGSISSVFLFSNLWAIEVFKSSIIISLLVLTPLLHLGSNIIAFKLDIKEEPW